MMPPLAMALIWMFVASTISFGKYGASQSPSALQSDAGLPGTKRTIGAVEEAATGPDNGASETASAAIAGAVTLGNAMKVGNCAVSCTDGFASDTSYAAWAAPLVRVTAVTEPSVGG